ncbi:MAG TPA: ATP-binding cassette domain-containing protein, partial [Candidatus Tectomicrobia bacterium]|nr:ATP-binding cassette domain-containing protein [Candidatus Tectomicrobia bacterium]
MSLLSVAGVTKRFGGVVASRDISFEVRAGELVGVIGPNGAGKSTLFDLITGFQRPDAGAIRIDARDA